MLFLRICWNSCSFAPLKIKEKEKIYRAWYFLNRFVFFFRIGVRGGGDTLPHTKLNF